MEDYFIMVYITLMEPACPELRIFNSQENMIDNVAVLAILTIKSNPVLIAQKGRSHFIEP